MSDGDRQPVYLFEGFRLDARRRVLFGTDGQPIPLTSRLFDTLLYLVERPGQLVTKEKLLEAIWPHTVVEEQSLGKTISALRKTLGEKPEEHRFIVTKHGRGYRFVARVAVAPDETVVPDNAHGEGYPVADVAATSGKVPEPDLGVSEAGARIASATPAKTARHRYAIGALVLVAVVGAILVAVRGTPPDPSLRVRPWVAERGGQQGPVWSPDGRSTAFLARSAVGEPFHLYARSLDDRVARTVLRLDAASTGPTALAEWTTDGRILYWFPPGLWSLSPVAAEPMLVATMELGGQRPGHRGVVPIPDKNMHVTRDGTAVATLGQAEDGTIGLWTAKLPEAKFEPYEPAPFATRSLWHVPFVRFSPDGKHLLLLWTAGSARGQEAWLLPFPPNPAAPPRRVLERLPIADLPEFSWLPDNRHIVVTTGRPRAMYVADVETGAFRLLANGQTDDPWNPVVSPEGDKLTYTEFHQDYDIVTLDLRTAALTPLIATNRMEIMPSWGTSADALVYVTDRSGEWEIWLHEPPKPDRPLVTTDDFPTATEVFMAPALSPDGERVIYTRGELGPKPSLWMSSVAGGAPERVTNDAAEEFPGSWSPDGAWYAYLALEGVSQVLKKVRTTGRATPETLAKLAGGLWLPSWSPDGAWVLLPNDGVLLSTDGTTRRDLKRARAWCAFARAEPLLHCIQPAPPGERLPLVAIDFDGNVVHTFGSLPREHLPDNRYFPATRLSPTPDGNGLTYSVNNTSRNMLLMEGLAAIDLP